MKQDCSHVCLQSVCEQLLFLQQLSYMPVSHLCFFLLRFRHFLIRFVKFGTGIGVHFVSPIISHQHVCQDSRDIESLCTIQNALTLRLEFIFQNLIEGTAMLEFLFFVFCSLKKIVSCYGACQYQVQHNTEECAVESAVQVKMECHTLRWNVSPESI